MDWVMMLLALAFVTTGTSPDQMMAPPGPEMTHLLSLVSAALMCLPPFVAHASYQVSTRHGKEVLNDINLGMAAVGRHQNISADKLVDAIERFILCCGMDNP
jgi:hypothetical protein